MNVELFSSLVLAGIVLVLASGVIAALVAAWVMRTIEERGGRRERRDVAEAEFYRAYGGFFAAWKAWAAFKSDGGGSQKAPTQEQWMALLSRVAEAEGQLESFLVRMTLERQLELTAIARLWCFRQGYQQLRYAVRDGRPLGWLRAPGASPEDPQRGMDAAYVAFERVALDVASLLARDRLGRQSFPPLDAAQHAFELISAPTPPSLDPPIAIDRPAWAGASPGAEASWQWVVLVERLPAAGQAK